MHLSSFTPQMSLHPSFSRSGGHVNLGPAHLACLWQFCACLSIQTWLSAIKVTVLEDEQDPRRQKAQQLQQALQIATKLAALSAYQKQRPTGAMNAGAAQSDLFLIAATEEKQEKHFFLCSFNQRRGLFHVS